MKLLVLAISAFCLTQVRAINTDIADMEFPHKQKKIYDLLKFVDQADLRGSEWYEIGRNYDIVQHIENYNDQMIVREFMFKFKLGMLNRKSLFSIYNKEDGKELIVLFKLFNAADDFNTFYRTACWSRHYINPELFATAFMTSVMNRPDCQNIVLPPTYEVYPHLFFENEIIQEARRYSKKCGTNETTMEGYFSNYYLIDRDANYQYLKYYESKENLLSYFTEDAGLGNYYYYIRNVFPFWISLSDLDILKHVRGELYYYIHQQLMARYYLERLSNDMGEIEDIDFHQSFAPAYFPNLVHRNGVPIPNRDRHSQIPFYKNRDLNELENIESRILAAIDSGFIYNQEGKQCGLYTPEGLNFLGNIIEGNKDSYNTRIYGSIDALYRNILSFGDDCKHKNCFVPSVLQTPITSYRDPAFYRIYKRIVGYFLKYKSHLPSYSCSELEFPGIEIEDVKVSKLVTFMEFYDYDITNAVFVDSFEAGMSYNIKARRYRLNYEPFTFHIDVKSDKSTTGMVRIFLGPSMDNDFQEPNYMYYNWYNFVELDKFSFDFKVGMNTIKRNSTDSIFTANDFMGSDNFYKKLYRSIEGNSSFTYHSKVYGFPNNLYLPRGKTAGLPIKLFVFVSEFDETNITNFDFPMFGKVMYDGKPFGFPLDRPISPDFFDLSNIYFKDVNVYYKKNNSNYQKYENMYSEHMDYMSCTDSNENVDKDVLINVSTITPLALRVPEGLLKL